MFEGIAQNWIGIASKIPGRTDKQCRDRWNQNLKKKWKAKDLEELNNLRQKYGSDIEKIEKEIPGRTKVAI